MSSPAAVFNLSPSRAIRISVCILAHNEASGIGRMLESLSRQTVFLGQVASIQCVELLVVPNGCSDNTAEVARNFLEKLGSQWGPRICAQVQEIAEPGKSNAWNRSVHEYIDPDCDYICMIDADVQLIEPETLENVILQLELDPIAQVCCDLPVKSAALKKNRSLREWLSLNALNRTANPYFICGQLYCARASLMRQIVMPPGLPVEDGFLRAMVVTDLFRAPEDRRRVVRAPGASHTFEAYLSIVDLFEHRKRMMIGGYINASIYDFVSGRSAGIGAGKVIADELKKNPKWLEELASQRITSGGRWVIPRSYWFDHMVGLRGMPWFKRIKRLPLAMACTLFDLLVAISANRELKRRGGVGFW